MQKESKLSIMIYIVGIVLSVLFLFNKSINFILLSVILIIFSSFFQKKKNKIPLYTLLIIFFIGLSYYMFFEPLLRRQGFLEDWSLKIIINDLIHNSNIIPFKTIYFYLYNIVNYQSAYSLSLDTYGLFLNLFGNLLCLTPLAILLPLCSDKQKKPKKFVLTIIIIAVLIELLQIITDNGIFDIDDIILNVVGSIIVFFLVNPHIIYLIENILLKKENKLNIIQIIIRTFIIIILGITYILVYNYRHQTEIDYIEHRSNYKIKIEYKTNTCDSNIREYFYEDELYNYYLTCHSKKNTTIYINDKPYSVDEIFNNKTEYFIELYEFIEKGLLTESEEKHERLRICGPKGNNLSFAYNATDIIYFEFINTESTETETCTNIFMIPQKDGTAKANFYIENTDMTRTKLTYEFTVKDNKVTSYELVQKNKKSKKQYEQGFK